MWTPCDDSLAFTPSPEGTDLPPALKHPAQALVPSYLTLLLPFMTDTVRAPKSYPASVSDSAKQTVVFQDHCTDRYTYTGHMDIGRCSHARWPLSSQSIQCAVCVQSHTRVTVTQDLSCISLLWFFFPLHNLSKTTSHLPPSLRSNTPPRLS